MALTPSPADVLIIGGGIVGLATAYQLTQEHPGKSIVLLEKEEALAQHQSGNNSGVLHSGIYYQPNSLKAVNCREGRKAMLRFCETEEIGIEICGKVIVALNNLELPALQRIYERGLANGIQCSLIDRERLQEIEPHAAGIRGIHVPEAGIVDYKQVCARLAKRIREARGSIVTGARVTGMRQNGSVVVESTAGAFEASYAINCGGLYSDRLALLSGSKPAAKIIPFRGEYFQIGPAARHLCRNLIYPVPDPDFPFLGVHFTRTIHGEVECGPNAVLAFAREGYRKTDLNLRELAESLSYPGFVTLASKFWRVGLGEMWRSWNKAAFVRALQRLVPEIQEEHLTPKKAGVRAQAVTRDGKMVDDFLIQESARVINVCNAPSPAATASLHIGRTIVERLAAHW